MRLRYHYDFELLSYTRLLLSLSALIRDLLTAGIFFIENIYPSVRKYWGMSHGHMTFTILFTEVDNLCKFPYCMFIQKDCEDLVAEN